MTTGIGRSRTPAFPAVVRAASISNGLPVPSSQRAPFQPARTTMLVLAKAGIGALFTHARQPVWMHESPIRNENVPFGDGHTVELFATFLIGQGKEAEPLGGKVESTRANVSPPARRHAS